MKLNRRAFLGTAALAVAGVATEGCCTTRLAAAPVTKPEYHVFSRVFQFIRDYDRAAAVMKRCGYDGVEWTARPKGFIEPANAGRDLTL